MPAVAASRRWSRARNVPYSVPGSGDGPLRVWNPERGAVLGEEVRVAAERWSRLKGLLGSDPLRPGEGLLLVPCRGVHTYWMGYPIDALFLDRSFRVVALYPWLEPGRRSGVHREARFALELPAGTIQETGTAEGDYLLWDVAVPAESRSNVGT